MEAEKAYALKLVQVTVGFLIITYLVTYLVTDVLVHLLR